jgi:mycothiol synthase
MTPTLRLETVATLTPEQRQSVHRLIHRAQEADGVSPLNEAAMLETGRATCDPGLAHQLCWVGEDLAGYSFLDSATGEPIAQLVVDPAHRRKGVATTMLGELGFDPRHPETAHRIGQQVTLHAWSFGDLPTARAFAADLGYQPVRELLVMARSLSDLPHSELPAGVQVRSFQEADLVDLVRINARAFAHHPEQGALTEQDFRDRMKEPWFDPEGLLLAVRPDADGEQVLGFHWTKRHDTSLGEVYVIGVDPDHSGGGIGTVLLHRGLEYLAGQGASRVILYVEGSQRYVVRLYEATGFEVANRDMMYASPRPGDH